MATQFRLGDIEVDVVLKDIKNVHLSVNPPTGRVRISAPKRMKMDTIRVFAISKLAWIKQQQQQLRDQQRETPREYIDRESHYLWGKRYLLSVLEREAKPIILLKHEHMILQVRPETGKSQREAIMDEWYRQQLKLAVPPLLTKWQSIIGVNVRKFFVQRMKTKWGSCNQKRQTVRINTELAKKPPECLEYVVVHELSHLVVPTHNRYFVALLNRHMPNWRILRDELNALPISNKSWGNHA